MKNSFIGCVRYAVSPSQAITYWLDGIYKSQAFICLFPLWLLYQYIIVSMSVNSQSRAEWIGSYIFQLMNPKIYDSA